MKRTTYISALRDVADPLSRNCDGPGLARMALERMLICIFPACRTGGGGAQTCANNSGEYLARGLSVRVGVEKANGAVNLFNCHVAVVL